MLEVYMEVMIVKSDEEVAHNFHVEVMFKDV